MTEDEQAELARLREQMAQQHPLMISLPSWVDWLFMVHIDAPDWRQKWFRFPMVVMELDTLWRAWCQAWGSTGSVRAKQAWFEDADHALFRIDALFARTSKANSRDYQPQPVLTAAPTGTLGDFPGRDALLDRGEVKAAPPRTGAWQRRPAPEEPEGPARPFGH